MGHVEAQPRRYTVEEYFALEEASDVRYEFFEGGVFAMSGANSVHNDIIQNFILVLRPKPRGSRWTVCAWQCVRSTTTPTPM